VTALLGVALAAQAVLYLFCAVSFLAPAHRVWPPPSGSTWQLYATWSLSWLALSGVFLLALFAGNSLGLPAWLRVGLGVPLLVAGLALTAGAFRALSVATSRGVAGTFVRNGPYRFSRNPQYVGACLYLAGLVALSGSHLASICAAAIGLWFLAVPFVEEPWLAERFGAEYEAYRRTVPRFLGRSRASAPSLP
jgi:protein-S-isoprenylcysteine O-methyltransferase Ste14